MPDLNAKLAQANFVEFGRNPYPGRGIVAGLDETGENLVRVYWLMGRSENSRNRVLSQDGERVFTEAADPSKVKDPSLIIYNAMNELVFAHVGYVRAHVVSNGKQTDGVAHLRGRTPHEVMQNYEYEPDAPNYTPRITAISKWWPNRYTNRMNKLIISVLLTGVVLVGGFFVLNWYIYNQKQATTAANYKNAEYIIDGMRITLENGVSEIEITPDSTGSLQAGSASKLITRYFGNELETDLDGDGRDDVAFLLTQEGGGSGTFFYVVAALKTDRGYIGSDGYPLGDRIAPQSTNVSQNSRHRHVIVVNYADRASGEPMTTQPSVGKSVYLKLDPMSRQWGIVEPNFEGESR